MTSTFPKCDICQFEMRGDECVTCEIGADRFIRLSSLSLYDLNFIYVDDDFNVWWYDENEVMYLVLV